MSAIGYLPAIGLYDRATKLSAEDAILNFSKTTDIKKEVEYFRARVETIETPEQFIADRRLMRFALTSYDMESQIDQMGRIRQVMLSNPKDKYSMANRMADERYRTLMRDFDFVNSGVEKLKDSEFISKITAGYLTIRYEEDAGQMNGAVSDALYFKRKITGVSKTIQLYADPVLFEVVKQALNLPDSALTGSVERVTKMIEQKFDPSKTSDPKYVDQFIRRYLAMKDLKNYQSQGNPVLGIFSGQQATSVLGIASQKKNSLA